MKRQELQINGAEIEDILYFINIPLKYLEKVDD